jgi:hypothetical protein
VSHITEPQFNFHALLYHLDRLAWERVRAAGCPRCCGPLHAAHYARKARGLGPSAHDDGRYDLRLSLCCGREGCRARATPPSLRFSGRRVYAAIAVLLLSLKSNEAREAIDQSAVVAQPQAPAWATRSRWQRWWQVGLFATSWFQIVRGHFATPADSRRSPGSLLSQYAGELCMRCVQLLKLLSPLTTQSVSCEFSRMAMAL